MSYMYVSCDSHVTQPLPGVARLTVKALPAGIVIHPRCDNPEVTSTPPMVAVRERVSKSTGAPA